MIEFKLTKEVVLDILSRSKIKQPKKDRVIELANELDTVGELIEQMRSDTIEYTFNEYIEVTHRYSKLVVELVKATRDVRW